ncbi:MAG: FAD-dependent oxidoreductase [Verrucomicrobiota bacterium]
MSKHILIIGSGVIGLSVAYYLVREGHRVTIIERAAPEDEGCSYRNAGMIVPSHFIPLAAPGMVALGLKWMWNPESPFYIKPRLNADLLSWGWRFYRAATSAHVNRAAPLLRELSLASRSCFEALAALPEWEFGLVKKGLLMLCKSEHTLAEEAQTAERAKALGIPAQVLDAKQTAALEPNVRMDIAGAVYFPKDCHLSPSRFMGALRRQLGEAGVRFEWRTEVTGWHAHGRQIETVLTSQGEKAADEFVLCGGSWSPLAVRDLGLRVPMQAGKGYSVTLPKPRQLPEICSIFTEARVAVTPIDGALRFGGTMEIAGLNSQINPARVQGIIKAVPRYYPDFKPDDFRDLPVWCGLRPCSPDGLPYLGRTNAYSNLSLATGHAMMGLSLAPITGKLLAEILQNQKPSIDISLLHPDRYG